MKESSTEIIFLPPLAIRLKRSPEKRFPASSLFAHLQPFIPSCRYDSLTFLGWRYFVAPFVNKTSYTEMFIAVFEFC